MLSLLRNGYTEEDIEQSCATNCCTDNQQSLVPEGPIEQTEDAPHRPRNVGPARLFKKGQSLNRRSISTCSLPYTKNPHSIFHTITQTKQRRNRLPQRFMVDFNSSYLQADIDDDDDDDDMALRCQLEELDLALNADPSSKGASGATNSTKDKRFSKNQLRTTTRFDILGKGAALSPPRLYQRRTSFELFPTHTDNSRSSRAYTSLPDMPLLEYYPNDDDVEQQQHDVATTSKRL